MNNIWYTRIKSFYDKGYYTKEQIQAFVPKYISEEEYLEIVGAE